MSHSSSTAMSPTHSHFLNPRSAFISPPYRQSSNGPAYPANSLPVPSNALLAEADARLNLGLDEDEEVWKGESVGLGFGLLGRLKEKTNALLEEIDWDCKLCGKTSTDPCVTRCGHLFCWSHLTRHLSQRPYCPDCGTPLAMDRDVVQVFGRPKVVPQDAPWTSAAQTPGSRGSAVDVNSIPNQNQGYGFSRSSTLSVDSSPSPSVMESSQLPSLPPPASPVRTPLRSRSQNDLTSSASSSNAKSLDQPKRKQLKPLTTISNLPPPNVLITTDSPVSLRGTVSLNDHEEREENDPWGSWRRASTSSQLDTLVPATRRQSQVSIAKRSNTNPTPARSNSSGNLRPPSPQLRTRPFRPGWGSRKSSSDKASSSNNAPASNPSALSSRSSLRREGSNASTDSFDQHVRQSVEVKFQRGIPSSFPDDNTDEEGEGEEEEQTALYVDSRKNSYVVGGAGMKRLPEALPILSPVPQYGWKTNFNPPISPPTTIPSAVSSTASEQVAAPPSKEAPPPILSSIVTPVKATQLRAEGRGAYQSLVTQRHQPAVQSDGPSKAELESKEEFEKLKIAVEKTEGGGVLADPVGRAMCVFAVVLLVKILLK